MSKTKITTTLMVLTVCLVAAFSIPLPLHVEAPFLIDPAGARKVYVSTPGKLDDIRVQEGDQVEKGDVLAVLSNTQLADELRQFETERATERKRLHAFAQARETARVVILEQKIEGLEKRIADTKQRLAELTIEAPITGVVVAPPEKQESSPSDYETTLPQWSGTPLEQKNLGAFLQEGTQLLVIAPRDTAGKIEATLLVDQADRNDIYVGQPVELRFEHLPDEILESTVESFAARHVEFAPPALSGKYGGPLPTTSDSQGRERLTSNAYQATVLLEEKEYRMLPGMRGIARLDAANRSAAEWIWRYLRQTFYFRL